MWTSAYWKALGENLVKVAAASMAAMVTADGFNMIQANWGDVFSVTGTAVLGAFLLSLAAGAVTSSTGPDFRSKETERELADTSAL